MDEVFDFIKAYLSSGGMSHPAVSAWLLAIVLSTLGIVYRAQVTWWLTLAWYKFPMIGKLVRLSRDTSASATAGWLNSERTLCADFKKFIHFMEPDDFRNRLSYIKKAQDAGRKPLPVWFMSVLFVLVVFEALGFSYLLGTWMAREGSANIHTILMITIVVVLAVVLVFITHKAGAQLFRTNLIRACRKSWNENGKPGQFGYGEIMLDERQSQDDDKPIYIQTIHRVGTSGTYVMMVITIVTIALIAVASTWMRMKSLEGSEIDNIIGAQAATMEGNPFATLEVALPREVTQTHQAAQDKAMEDRRQALHAEGQAAFLTLAVIFVVTQVVGVYAGHHWGFAGKYSEAAYHSTRGFATYNDFVAFYEPRLHVTQSLLNALQQQIEENIQSKRGGTPRSFLDYLNEAQHRLNSQAPASAARKPTATEPRSLERVLAEYDQLDGKEARMAYLRDLDAADLEAIRPILAERKERERKQQQVDATIADLV